MRTNMTNITTYTPQILTLTFIGTRIYQHIHTHTHTQAYMKRFTNFLVLHTLHMKRGEGELKRGEVEGGGGKYITK